MPATAALDALMSSSESKRSKVRTGDSPRRCSMGSLPIQFMTGTTLALSDLFQVAQGLDPEEMSFPAISWDSTHDERIGGEHAAPEGAPPQQQQSKANTKRLPPPHSLSWSPGEAQKLQSSSLGKRSRNLARSKTFRTSIATLGGASSTHLCRNL